MARRGGGAGAAALSVTAVAHSAPALALSRDKSRAGRARAPRGWFPRCVSAGHGQPSTGVAARGEGREARDSAELPALREAAPCEWSVERDRGASALASRQAGNITTAQLVACGFDKDAVALWVRHGRLHREHRGVFRLGHTAAAPFARHWAAFLAVGRATALCHEAAAHLGGFAPAPEGPIDVAVPPSHRSARTDVLLHRLLLEARDLTRRHGLPCTTAERTIIDLAGTHGDIGRLVQEACATYATTPAKLRRALARHAGARGTAALRAALAGDVDDLRSKAERALRRSFRAGGLRPRYNARIEPWRVDAYWPEQRLVLEIDGYGAHSSPWAHEPDRRKDLDLRARRIDVIRVSARQALDAPESVLAAVVRALADAERLS